MTLKTTSNFFYGGHPTFRKYRPGDDFYEELIRMHNELSEEESARVNARLILLLANHIGDVEVLKEAMRVACNESS